MSSMWKFGLNCTERFGHTFASAKATDLINLSSYNLSSQFIQKREMSRVKRRLTHPLFIWPVKRRERNDQQITPDNQAFINQVISDKYGPAYIPNSTGMPYVSPLKENVQPRAEWTPNSVRTGVIVRKLGMYPIWDKNGNKMRTTLLQVVDNHVVKYISPDETEKNYGKKFGPCGLVIVGAESTDPQMFTKDYCGLFTESGLMPKVRLNRFTVTPDAALQPGTPLYASHFQVGQIVDVCGLTIERGWQGVMKRWRFHGMPATHGCTKSHRRGGNIGGGGEKGRVWPGTKMPGHMGSERRIQFGYKILRINTKYNIIFVRGPTPGEVNKFLTIRDTFLPGRHLEVPPPFPTYYPDEASEPLPEDIFHPDVHTYSDPTILFEDKA